MIQYFISMVMMFSSLDFRNEFHDIYTDYEKTFDNVDHGIFSQKYYAFGIRRKFST